MTHELQRRVIEAEILKSKGKLTGIRFAGTLVVALMLLSVPGWWLSAIVSMVRNHEPLEFGYFGSAALTLGSFVVAFGFGYLGYRLILRAFSS